MLCAGEGGGGLLGSQESHQLRVQLHRVPVQPPGPAALPRPALHDRRRLPVPLRLAHRAPRHAGREGRRLCSIDCDAFCAQPVLDAVG